MIKSERKTFGFWLLVSTIAFFTLLAISTISKFYFDFSIIYVKVPSQQSFNTSMVIYGLTFLIFGLTLSQRASSISIDTEDEVLKTISFRNLFTRQIKSYSFQFFDGYITTRLWHKQFNENKTICLIKDGKVVKKIDNFFYSNLDELEKGLENLNYLGFKRMDIPTSFKVIFNQPIIKP